MLTSIKTAIDRWNRYRRTIRELSAMSDCDLNDIGITRGMIEEVARESIKKEYAE